VSGILHAADATAADAQNSLTSAYNSLTSQACTQDLTGQDLGGKTLLPGVYCFSSSAQLTGILTLNAQGNANATFIFKMGSTLTTASGASVVVINSASLCNIFWQVGSSATLGTGTSFAGNILAQASITLTTGSSVTGRTLARTGAVTLDSSTVTAACTTGTPSATCPAIALAPTALPSGTIGVPYSQLITGSGGTAPYTFGMSAGVLPIGMTLSTAGLLSGLPTTVGSSATVLGVDANGCSATLPYTLTLTCAPITLSPATLPAGTVGAAYSQTIVGSGGTGPYVYTLASGTLPAGLTITSAGVLSGTPTTAGTSTVSIRGTDANGCFKETAYTLNTIVAVPTLPQWGALLLVMLLVGLGYLRLRRRSVGTARLA
jgi:hypothetical protein